MAESTSGEQCARHKLLHCRERLLASRRRPLRLIRTKGTGEGGRGFTCGQLWNEDMCAKAAASWPEPKAGCPHGFLPGAAVTPSPQADGLLPARRQQEGRGALSKGFPLQPTQLEGKGPLWGEPVRPAQDPPAGLFRPLSTGSSPVSSHKGT